MSSFTNLSRLIGHCIRDNGNWDYLRYAVVKNGVVSVTNGTCIIRRPTPGIPDGKYHFGFGDQLIPAEESVKFSIEKAYPDIELLLPKQEQLLNKSIFCVVGSMGRNEISALSAYVHQVKMRNDQMENGWRHERIVLTNRGVCRVESVEVCSVTRRPLTKEESDNGDIDSTEVDIYHVVIPLNLDLAGNCVQFNTDTLSVALVELQQYESISILKKISNDEREPFFIGAGLDRCAVIVPFNVEIMDGQYFR